MGSMPLHPAIVHLPLGNCHPHATGRIGLRLGALDRPRPAARLAGGRRVPGAPPRLRPRRDSHRRGRGRARRERHPEERAPPARSARRSIRLGGGFTLVLAGWSSSSGGRRPCARSFRVSSPHARGRSTRPARRPRRRPTRTTCMALPRPTPSRRRHPGASTANTGNDDYNVAMAATPGTEMSSASQSMPCSRSPLSSGSWPRTID